MITINIIENKKEMYYSIELALINNEDITDNEWARFQIINPNKIHMILSKNLDGIYYIKYLHTNELLTYENEIMITEEIKNITINNENYLFELNPLGLYEFIK